MTMTRAMKAYRFMDYSAAWAFYVTNADVASMVTIIPGAEWEVRIF